MAEHTGHHPQQPTEGDQMNYTRALHPVEQWVQHITRTTPDLILGTLQQSDLEITQQLAREMQQRGLTSQDLQRLKDRKHPTVVCLT
jgi:hypothetical protein